VRSDDLYYGVLSATQYERAWQDLYDYGLPVAQSFEKARVLVPWSAQLVGLGTRGLRENLGKRSLLLLRAFERLSLNVAFLSVNASMTH